MADFLRNWIINITVVIIFIMFLDTIIPNSSMKRYINVIVGLTIIVVVIKPFVLIKEYADNFNTNIIETTSYIEQSGSGADSTEIIKFQQQKAVEIFENNLKSRIEKVVDKSVNSEFEEVSIDLELDKDFESNHFGEIKSIKVSISKSPKKVPEVDRIRIMVNEGMEVNKNVINKDKVEYNLNNSKIRSDIRNGISEALEINESIVSVEVRQ